MCLGIPGRLTEFVDTTAQLAKVEVSGVTRTISIALLDGESLEIDDWVLIHVGFAMAKIDEAEAESVLSGLEQMGRAYEEELRSFATSGHASAEEH